MRAADRGRTSPPPLDGETSEGEPIGSIPLAGVPPRLEGIPLAGAGGTGFRCDFGVVITAGALDRRGATTAFAAGSVGWRPPCVRISAPQ